MPVHTGPPPPAPVPAWPPALAPDAPYKLGDEVIITGDFKLNSPHSERNSEGLIVYKSMKNVTAGWESPPMDPNAAPPPAEGEKLSPEDIVKQKRPG